MINLTKGQANTITVTLRENATVAAPIYLFKFVNQQSQVAYYVIGTDTSLYTDRYNQFVITEQAANADTLNGEVILGAEGFYNYYAYQTDLASTAGLADAEAAVPNIVKEVEVGLMWVIPEALVVDEFNTSQTTFIVYTNTFLLLQSLGFLLNENGSLFEL